MGKCESHSFRKWLDDDYTGLCATELNDDGTCPNESVHLLGILDSPVAEVRPRGQTR